MKKLILFFITLFPLVSLCQNKPIDGFMGIKFGSSKDTVSAILKAKGGVPATSVNLNELSFTGLAFGERKTYMVTCQFVNNKLSNGYIFLIADKEAQTVELYSKVVDELKSVYGKSDEVRESKHPFEAAGYEITAIRDGYSTINDLWSDEKNKSFLRASLSSDLTIVLLYQDSKLSAEAKKVDNLLKED